MEEIKMKKIVVVVVEGCVESVYTDVEEDVELEIIDFFDGQACMEDEERSAYIEECRETMREL
jgi:hypothetical protein